MRRLWSLLVVLAPAMVGCSRSLDLNAGGDAKVPTTTVYYTGVRSDARRYAEYGSIDRSVLRSRR